MKHYPTIGLMGVAGCGKDTVGAYLVKKYGYVRVAYADKAKRILMDIFNLSQDQLYGDQKEVPDRRLELTPRQIMQYWLDACRELDKGVWVRPVQEFIRTSRAPVVVTDIRRDNEHALIQILGGQIWKIEREGAGVKHGIPDHTSETDWEYFTFDKRICNDFSIKDLYSAIDQLMGGPHD